MLDDRRRVRWRDRWLPELDTVETDGTIRIMLDASGMAESDIDVEIDGDRLTIRGTRKIDARQEPRAIGDADRPWAPTRTRTRDSNRNRRG